MARPAILAVNYYTARQELGYNTTLSALRFFADQDGGYNDLPTGYLPDDRVGDITGIFVRLTPKWLLKADANTSVSASASYALRSAQVVEWARGLRVSLLVNGVRVMRGPIWAFPHPPSWVQGSSSATDNGSLRAQNSGYRLMDIAHPVGQRQSLSVEIDPGSVDMTGNRGSSATDGDLSFEITLQIADRKPIA